MKRVVFIGILLIAGCCTTKPPEDEVFIAKSTLEYAFAARRNVETLAANYDKLLAAQAIRHPDEVKPVQERWKVFREDLMAQLVTLQALAGAWVGLRENKPEAMENAKRALGLKTE